MSNAEASSARHGVIRVQDRSVSPGEYWPARARSQPTGSSAAAASVIRRPASEPSGSAPGSGGGAPNHHVTTGLSGASSGSTTDSAWSPSCPYTRSTTDSPAPRWPPTVTSASSRDSSEPGCRRMTTSSRQGCAAVPAVAASIAARAARSSTTVTRVSTTPVATAPAVRRSFASVCTTSPAVVSHSVVTGAARCDRRRPASRPRRPVPRSRRRTDAAAGRPSTPRAGRSPASSPRPPRGSGRASCRRA